MWPKEPKLSLQRWVATRATLERPESLAMTTIPHDLRLSCRKLIYFFGYTP
jgi:hypothetical protein